MTERGAETMLKMYILALIIWITALSSSDGNNNARNLFERSYDNSTLRCLVLGDWGGLPDFPYRTYIETAVAHQMGKLSSQINAKFVLALGDNFYFDGVKDIQDPRFNETFENVFTTEVLQNIPWYVIAGNHDWHGNVSAQILYTKISKRWNFPSLYYNLMFSVGEGVDLEILMIDTIQLCGNTDDFNTSNTHFTRVASRDDAEQQWKWIETHLSQSKSTYLLVAGHYPIWSIAEHGPTKCLQDRLMPMLYKYHATAYLSGHDHNLQHLSWSQSNWKLEYFVIGAANFIDGSVLHKNTVPAGSLKFHWADYLSLGGFGFLEVTGTSLNFTFTDSKGKILHNVKMQPRF